MGTQRADGDAVVAVPLWAVGARWRAAFESASFAGRKRSRRRVAIAWAGLRAAVSVATALPLWRSLPGGRASGLVTTSRSLGLSAALGVVLFACALLVSSSALAWLLVGLCSVQLGSAATLIWLGREYRGASDGVLYDLRRWPGGHDISERGDGARLVKALIGAYPRLCLRAACEDVATKVYLDGVGMVRLDPDRDPLLLGTEAARQEYRRRSGWRSRWLRWAP